LRHAISLSERLAAVKHGLVPEVVAALSVCPV
jgi:hypothetical protein